MHRLSLIALALVAGAAGFLIRGWATPFVGAWAGTHRDDHEGAPHADGEHGDEHDHGDEEEPHVPLSREAFDSLALRLEPASIAPFVKTSMLPAEVVEYPGVSASKLAAPVTGVVVAIATQPGAAVAPGDALFELRITDERVLDAQLRLLESLTRLEIVEEELRRLEPLAASGAVRGRERRDFEYEGRELRTAIDLRRGELAARGLTDGQVDRLIETKELLRTVVVRTPLRRDTVDGSQADGRGAPVRPVAWEDPAAPLEFTAENILVQPGETVERGEALCDLASHARLYLRALAYEADLPRIIELARDGAPLAAEFGHSLETHRSSASLVEGLRVRYVANHVDPTTQSYPFFLPLDNQVLNESSDEAGFRYRTWRFSVGQRGHVLAPTRSIEGHIPLPIDAVAVEGLEAFVFCPHAHGGAPHDHDHEEEAFIELEPVPVTLLYRDNRHAVVASGGQLREGDRVAMNAAHQLLMALRAESEGGGQHHHHDH